MSEKWSARTVLVTGGSGFLGSHLVRRLAGLGADVHVPTTRSKAPWRIEGVDVTLHPRTDLTSSDDVRAILAVVDPEVVFHLAAFGVQRGQESIDRMLAVNVGATGILMEQLADRSVERVVHVGTCLEYAADDVIDEGTRLDPMNLYAATKAAAARIVEFYARYRELPLVTVRPVAAYGPREDLTKLVPHVIVSALRRRPIALTEGTQVREYLYVDDVVAGLIAAAQADLPSGDVINLGSGQPVQVRDLAHRAIAQTGEQDVTLDLGAIPSSRHEPQQVRTDVRKAKEVLSWEPQTPLDEGLMATVAWYRENASHMPGSRS